MLTKKFKEISLSALGMGAMRLPVIDGDDSKVDQAAVQEMVDYAMAHGVNYYDTAWGYHGGNSELSMGMALSKYPRESYYLADKFPGYDLSNMDKVSQIFEEQLKKCRVEYFDFYLFHNVCEMNINQYLDKSYGIYDYLIKQRNEGRIKHLGFSVHGSSDVLKRFLDTYGDDMEFCQIQLNWVDYDFQNAREKIEILTARGIPIWVMEPLRGGRLARLSKEAEATLKSMRPDETVPGWSFRFIQAMDNVKVTLSGMSDFNQLKENIKTFESDEPLNDNEKNVLFDIAKGMTGGVPCTACHYCVTHCPQGLDIPRLLNLYNEHSFTQGGFIAPMALMAIPRDKHPDACIGCRSCEAVCPQQIKISEAMSDFASMLK